MEKGNDGFWLLYSNHIVILRLFPHHNRFPRGIRTHQDFREKGELIDLAFMISWINWFYDSYFKSLELMETRESTLSLSLSLSRSLSRSLYLYINSLSLSLSLSCYFKNNISVQYLHIFEWNQDPLNDMTEETKKKHHIVDYKSAVVKITVLH